MKKKRKKDTKDMCMNTYAHAQKRIKKMPKNTLNKSKQGKKNRAAGGSWERKVRADLEKNQGFFVSKFMNNVEFEFSPQKGVPLFKGKKINPQFEGKLIPAKRKYNPFNKALSVGTGFPDFIAWYVRSWRGGNYGVIGVEAKSNGYLDKEEKEKCEWLLKNKVFRKIFIAKKKKEGRKVIVEYIDFRERYMQND